MNKVVVDMQKFSIEVIPQKLKGCLIDQVTHVRHPFLKSEWAYFVSLVCAKNSLEPAKSSSLQANNSKRT